MPFRIVPVVEGDGEIAAVPVLFNRLIAEFDPGTPIKVERPIKQQKSSLLKEGGIERAVSLAAISLGDPGAIFILLDSDGDCPARLGPRLYGRARGARPDKQISLVLAHQEFEAWFLASGSSLKGLRTLSDNIENHQAPESVRGCKEWLETWMPAASRYSPTTDQAALAATFDMSLARRGAPSFDKLCREFEAICQYARSVVVDA
jgi:hypothetical protein